MEIALLSILGVFVGFASGFFGIGGGAIVVTVLLYFGYDVKEAIGISVVQMVLSSLFGSYLNYKRGLFKLNQSVYVGIGGLIGGAFSGVVIASVPAIALEVLLAIVLALGILKAGLKKGFNDIEIKLSKGALIVIGAAIGLVAISAGIGGGVLIGILFFGFFGYDIKKAVSMGLFFVVFASISGLISISLNVGVNWGLGYCLGLERLLGCFLVPKRKPQWTENYKNA